MADAIYDLRRYIVPAASIAFGGLLCGLIFLGSGLYNISASPERADLTSWVLDATRRQSVRTHSQLLDIPPLTEDMARLGAAHYARGCAACHGAPGLERSPLARTMNPEPPELAIAATHWSEAELFWLTLNGQKFTAMPAWPAQGGDAEAWAVVAFLRVLPDLDAEGYAAMSGGAAPDCATCHGEPGATPFGLAPNLSGQNLAYLERAFAEYRDGTRPSGMMRLVAAGLTDADAAEALADYASVTRPAPTLPQTEIGAELATAGLPAREIPACLSCHGETGNPQIPRLDGLSVEYLAHQLDRFADGYRDESPHAAIMAPIAARLTHAEKQAAALYFASSTAEAAP